MDGGCRHRGPADPGRRAPLDPPFNTRQHAPSPQTAHSWRNMIKPAWRTSSSTTTAPAWQVTTSLQTASRRRSQTAAPATTAPASSTRRRRGPRPSRTWQQRQRQRQLQGQKRRQLRQAVGTAASPRLLARQRRRRHQARQAAAPTWMRKLCGSWPIGTAALSSCAPLAWPRWAARYGAASGRCAGRWVPRRRGRRARQLATAPSLCT